MEKAIDIILNHGLLGALLFMAGIVIYKLYTKTEKVRDNYEEKLEIHNKAYVSLIEKSFNTVNAIEKELIENKHQLSKEVIQSIQSANQPLLTEVKTLLDEIKKTR